MRDENCQYVLIACAPRAAAPDAVPALVVSFGELTSRVQTFVVQPWLEIITPKNQVYLEALAEDWENCPRAEVSALMEQLSGLSLGILRTVRVGNCTVDEIETIAGTFLDAPNCMGH